MVSQRHRAVTAAHLHFPQKRIDTMSRMIAIILAFWSISLSVTVEEFPPYTVNPGDILQISVWKEKELQLELLVRPDGGFSMPLIGEVQAQGKTAEALRQQIAKRLSVYVPAAVVTVAVRQTTGNKISVLGEVNKPGEFIINRYVDVMQALSMAGGTAPGAGLGGGAGRRRRGGGRRAAGGK